MCHADAWLLKRNRFLKHYPVDFIDLGDFGCENPEIIFNLKFGQ